MNKIFLAFLSLAITYSTFSQKKKSPSKWYDKIKVGGYMQVRYNGLFETNPNLYCEQCDENWGPEEGGLSLRRMRFKLKGYISPRVYLYFQPDFAKSINDEIHIGRLKDAYIDIGVVQK